MLARFRTSTEESEQGLTLVPLLLVMILMSSLAACGSPVSTNQQPGLDSSLQQALDSSMKSDIRTVANMMETAYMAHQAYPHVAGNARDVASLTVGSHKVPLSKGTQIIVVLNTPGTAYCIRATNASAKSSWAYQSNAGGMQAAGYTCPVASAF